MKRTGLGLAGLVLAALTLLTGSAQAQVNVTIYDGFQDAGGGAPFSNPVGSFIAPQIDFATSTGYNWHPFDRGAFGAQMTGCIVVPTTGEYTFGTNSDDGSQFFLNSNLVVDNGGPHGPNVVFGAPVTLTAGVEYPFQLDFFEDFGGPSGVDLLLATPAGVEIVPASFFAPCTVPEPGTLALLATCGLTGLGLVARRRVRK